MNNDEDNNIEMSRLISTMKSVSHLVILSGRGEFS